jgi:hypothetical protein
MCDGVSRRVKMQVEIKVVGSRIYINAPFEMKDTLKNIPTARWESRHRMWSFAATPSAAQKLDALSPDITDDKFRDLLDQSFNIGSAEIFKDQDDLPQPECRKNDSWNHQLAAYWFVTTLWGGVKNDKS